MRVPFFDYRPEYRALKPEIDAAVARVLESGRLVLGPEVEAFEREFAAWIGVRAAVGVNSGTDALVLALRALEIGPGDEVVTVANAGAPTVAAIRAAGAMPRFVDVLPGTLLLDPDGLESALTPRVRAVLPVHLYGQCAEMGAILDFASRKGLVVIEDCAQAHGATHAGRMAGSLGAIGCFSFYPTKNIGAYGDGGLCVTDDPALEERLRLLRMYGFRGDREAHVEGVCTRLDELQAAILRVKLRHAEASLTRRRAIAERYRTGLAGSSLSLLDEIPGSRHVYHLVVVRGPGRDRVSAALDAAGLGWGVHYPVPAHRMEAYRFLGYADGALPVSEEASRSVLSLPAYPGLSDEAIDGVVQVARAVR